MLPQILIVLTYICFSMLSAAIILSGEAEKLPFDSLNTIEGVEWNGIFYADKKIPKQLDKALIFSSPDIMPMLSDVLVVLDPGYCKFDFLASAIRNGCHLFLTDKLKLNSEERKQLIHLAKEGGSYIQIQNDFLFQPFHKKIITRTNGTCFIEVRQSIDSMQGRLQDMLLNELFTLFRIQF